MSDLSITLYTLCIHRQGNAKSHWTARTLIEPPAQKTVEHLSTAPIVRSDVAMILIYQPRQNNAPTV